MRILSWLLLAITISACSSKFESLNESASTALDQVTCENSESALFDVMYESLKNVKKEPTAADLKLVFKNAITKKKSLKRSEQEILALTEEFYLILEKIPAGSLYEKLKKVAGAEIGLQTNAEEISTQKQISNFQKKWKKMTAQLETNCPTQDEGGSPVKQQPDKAKSVNPIVMGARRALATAYQSCTADEKKPMTTNTEEVRGIKVIGMHPDGVGKKRVIEDIEVLQATDYYYNGVSSGANCKDTRKFPLIYDYGGKPNTDSGDLNFFANSGDGTAVLGIDCSGYVFSAIAAAGLRLAPGKTVKADLVHALSSHAYLNPESNGLTCFARVKMGVSGSLNQGDIAAVGGHVFIVDSVGADPLGIQKYNSVEECAGITPADFDFIIAQSSSVKNGIGINKFEARDYLSDPETEKMRVGFVKYAQDACRARISGKDLQMTATNFQIIRHKMTSECKSSKSIGLAGESCVAQCPSLAQE